MPTRRFANATCLLFTVILLTEGAIVSSGHRHGSVSHSSAKTGDEIAHATKGHAACSHDRAPTHQIAAKRLQGETAIAPSEACCEECVSCRYWSLRQIAGAATAVAEANELVNHLVAGQRAIAGEPSLIVCRQRGPPLA